MYHLNHTVLSVYNMYDSVTIASKNNTALWNQTIKYHVDHPKDTLYRLHATGECTMNGRTYLALPADLDVSNRDVKKKYNLL